MAKIGDIVFDAAHPASLARFWAAELDGYAVAPYDDEELARLRANGINGPEDDPSVLVEPAVPDAPRLFFTLVPEAKVVKNRVHLDLRADDISAKAGRLVKLSATEVARLDGWITLADPEGNEFDVLPMK
ncbi:VOC family protein [Dactylosporangium sp. NPDC000555]|uniref:VOC family protein n=1 Tax=Dactylosporangium sp. NPDC000555 TaxID=3154260 RepID=UPI00332A6ACE